jgi:hypothetical protein
VPFSGLSTRLEGNSQPEREVGVLTAKCKAKNITLRNPDSHLTAYYRHRVKGGMSITEAYKRVGRALVRRLYRELKSTTNDRWQSAVEAPREPVEGDMATGSYREAQTASRNTSPSEQEYTPRNGESKRRRKGAAVVMIMISAKQVDPIKRRLVDSA